MRQVQVEQRVTLIPETATLWHGIRPNTVRKDSKETATLSIKVIECREVSIFYDSK